MITRVLLAGGTGLVGGLLAKRLRGRPDVELESLVRTASQSGDRVVDFAAISADPSLGGGTPVDVGICCLGTTLRRAGSRPAFRRVDHDFVVAFARAARARGADRFILMSSVGAGEGSFYLGVKGDAEASVAALGFRRLDLIRPSLLLGPRADRRPAERIAQAMAPLLTPLLRGSLARYAALDASVVAGAIDRLSTRTAPGHHVHHVPDLIALAAAR